MIAALSVADFASYHELAWPATVTSFAVSVESPFLYTPSIAYCPQCQSDYPYDVTLYPRCPGCSELPKSKYQR
jgi:hypothetical protein